MPVGGGSGDPFPGHPAGPGGPPGPAASAAPRIAPGRRRAAVTAGDGRYGPGRGSVPFRVPGTFGRAPLRPRLTRTGFPCHGRRTGGPDHAPRPCDRRARRRADRPGLRSRDLGSLPWGRVHRDGRHRPCSRRAPDTGPGSGRGLLSRLPALRRPITESEPAYPPHPAANRPPLPHRSAAAAGPGAHCRSIRTRAPVPLRTGSLGDCGRHSAWGRPARPPRPTSNGASALASPGRGSPDTDTRAVRPGPRRLRTHGLDGCGRQTTGGRPAHPPQPTSNRALAPTSPGLPGPRRLRTGRLGDCGRQTAGGRSAHPRRPASNGTPASTSPGRLTALGGTRRTCRRARAQPRTGHLAGCGRHSARGRPAHPRRPASNPGPAPAGSGLRAAERSTRSPGLGRPASCGGDAGYRPARSGRLGLRPPTRTGCRVREPAVCGRAGVVSGSSRSHRRRAGGPGRTCRGLALRAGRRCFLVRGPFRFGRFRGGIRRCRAGRAVPLVCAGPARDGRSRPRAALPLRPGETAPGPVGRQRSTDTDQHPQQPGQAGHPEHAGRSASGRRPLAVAPRGGARRSGALAPRSRTAAGVRGRVSRFGGGGGASGCRAGLVLACRRRRCSRGLGRDDLHHPEHRRATREPGHPADRHRPCGDGVVRYGRRPDRARRHVPGAGHRPLRPARRPPLAGDRTGTHDRSGYRALDDTNRRRGLRAPGTGSAAGRHSRIGPWLPPALPAAPTRRPNHRRAPRRTVLRGTLRVHVRQRPVHRAPAVVPPTVLRRARRRPCGSPPGHPTSRGVAASRRIGPWLPPALPPASARRPNHRRAPRRTVLRGTLRSRVRQCLVRRTPTVSRPTGHRPTGHQRARLPLRPARAVAPSHITGAGRPPTRRFRRRLGHTLRRPAHRALRATGDRRTRHLRTRRLRPRRNPLRHRPAAGLRAGCRLRSRLRLVSHRLCAPSYTSISRPAARPMS